MGSMYNNRRPWKELDIPWEGHFDIQYIPRNMHTVFALLCFVVVIHWLIFPYPPGLLHWHCGNLTIAPVPAKQPWWIWINTSCEFIMNDCITTTKQSTTKPCAYFLGYTVFKQTTQWCHHRDTHHMAAMTSDITSNLTICCTKPQRKHQRSAFLALAMWESTDDQITASSKSSSNTESTY